MYVLNCRSVAPLAYNSPMAYPQPASTALPMEYGQGLCQTVVTCDIYFLVKYTASEMTYIVSSVALNSTQPTNLGEIEH